MAPLTKNEKKKHPLLPMTLINMFEKSCGIFRGRGGRNPLLSHNTRSICSKIKLELKVKVNFLIKKNDHGVDVNIIIVT
jgi:hypothetical protein